LFGPGATDSGFCGNPGQTCTTGVCDDVGDPGAGAFCPQEFGQACVGGECQPVDGSAIVCPLANGLVPGENLTPLPGDLLERSWGSLLFAEDTTTCGLKMVMDRDETGVGGRTLPGGWYINNPPDLQADGTQFLGFDAPQKTQ
jgi:hypothetical protein